MVISPENVLLVGAVLLFLSVLVGKTGARFGVPALLLFLGVGMLAGSDGFGIHFDSAPAAQFIGTVALCIILFSGGMDTSYREIKPVLAPGVTLATLGVLMTTVITGLFIYSLSDFLPGDFQLGLLESMLLAAVMSSTDSASVFSILRSKGISLKERLRPTLELESGSNDPMAYMLTLLLIQIIEIGTVDWGDAILLLVLQLVVGAALGFALGYAIVWVINRIDVPNESLYPVLLLACVFFVFAFTNLLQGNGYLAVYIAGLVVGNRKLVHKRSLTTFFDGFTWLFQIVMFLTLGLLVNPSELPAVAGVSLLVALFMIVVSRPLSVFVSLLPFRKFTTRARVYVSWVGLRGAVPIIFATYPLMSAEIPNARMIFNVVFFVTIVSLLVQGSTVSAMARWLGLIGKSEEKEIFDVALPDEIKSAMSEIELTEEALAGGNKLLNLSLPDNTLVVMVKRGTQYFVPKGHTQLEPGDRLLVISDNDEELRRSYESLGISRYTMRKNR